MAIAHRFFSFHAPFTTRRNPLIIVSSKTGQRKNYLRPKILKTLTKPSLSISPTLLQPPTLQPILSPPQEHELCVDIPSDEMHGEDIAGDVDETGEFEELRVSVDTAKDNGVFGNVSAEEIFKYGGIYLIGAFVFQTVCYLWNSRNLRNEHSNGDLEVSEREKRNILFGGNGKTVEDQFVEKKIEEIKLMAREARRIELLEKQGKGEEEEKGDTEIDGIEKEIVERLLKLKNRIKRNKDSSAALRLNSRGPRGNSDGDGDMNVNPGKEELVFKKKSKFKSPSTKAKNTPKGFPGTQDRRVSSVKPQDYGNQVTDRAGILDGDKQVNRQDVTDKNASGVPLEEREKTVDDESGEIQNEGKNLEEMIEKPNMKTKDGVKTKSISNGGFPETSIGMSSPEVRELRTQNFQGFEKDNVDSINGSSGHGLAKKNSAANKAKVKKAKSRTDIWWLNLRYVLVILMQRGSDGEGHKGLYSLNFTTKEREQNDDSYTVAFEDQADANNFCFLLESYFEDLGDNFSANAVPMSIQELNEEIISHGDKVVVVKKRQLQLYAGQLLTDVEMALCSIIEQDQNVP